jgi:hypothetical protein
LSFGADVRAFMVLTQVVSRVFRTFGFELSGARYWLKQ